MKVGPHLFAILAFGALSTNVAVARHYHRYLTGTGTAASHSGTNAQGVAKSPITTGAQQGSNPSAEGGVPDHVNADRADKDAADKSGPRSKTPSNTAVSPGTAIDTRITVYQGRDVHKNSKALTEIDKLKERLSKKSNTAIVPATDPTHQHAVGNFRKFSVTSVSRRRNAIGAVVDAGAAAVTANPVPPATNGVVSKANTFVSGANAVGAAPVSKPAGGDPSINNANTAGAQNIHRGVGSGAIGVAPPHGSSINGTGIGHPWSGTGAVGGAVKVVGVLNGTSFRSRHP